MSIIAENAVADLIDRIPALRELREDWHVDLFASLSPRPSRPAIIHAAKASA